MDMDEQVSEQRSNPPAWKSAISWCSAAAVCALAAGGTVIAMQQLPNSQPMSILAPTASPLEATPTPTPSATATPTPTPTATPDASTPATPRYDTTSPDSITVLVNKQYPLSEENYAPSELVQMASIGVPSMNDHSLRREAADAIKELFQAAAKAGHELDMTSGFRDRDLQQQLYEGYIADLGQEGADATSARPGHSEHQTGLAADISAIGEGCALEACFGDTQAGQWLQQNAWKYGFILRFPKDGTAVTGYEYEPWHFRYIGVDAAKAYHDSGAKTYEEFLGAGPAPDYK